VCSASISFKRETEDKTKPRQQEEEEEARGGGEEEEAEEDQEDEVNKRASVIDAATFGEITSAKLVEEAEREMEEVRIFEEEERRVRALAAETVRSTRFFFFLNRGLWTRE
jgi:hypothetical protein